MGCHHFDSKLGNDMLRENTIATRIFATITTFVSNMDTSLIFGMQVRNAAAYKVSPEMSTPFLSLLPPLAICIFRIDCFYWPAYT